MVIDMETNHILAVSTSVDVDGNSLDSSKADSNKLPVLGRGKNWSWGTCLTWLLGTALTAFQHARTAKPQAIKASGCTRAEWRDC